MVAVIASVYPKVRSWVASITSPSSTHASGMLIILGILAAVTEAQSVKEPIRVHHPKVSSRPLDNADPSASKEHEHQSSPEAIPLNNQEMLYYVAMGMLVSQGLIRFATYISNRRTAAAAQAAHKKDDDLAGNDDDNDDENINTNNKARKTHGGLSINAFQDLDEEAIQKRREHLAALNDNASLLGSDSEDEDYEQSEGEESSSGDEGLDEDEDEDDVLLEESEGEGELKRRRNVLAAGDAKN